MTDSSDLPNDPFTALTSAFTLMHETFTGCQAAGFTEDQALKIVGMLLKLVFDAAQQS